MALREGDIALVAALVVGDGPRDEPLFDESFALGLSNAESGVVLDALLGLAEETDEEVLMEGVVEEEPVAFLTGATEGFNVDEAFEATDLDNRPLFALSAVNFAVKLVATRREGLVVLVLASLGPALAEVLLCFRLVGDLLLDIGESVVLLFEILVPAFVGVLLFKGTSLEELGTLAFEVRAVGVVLAAGLVRDEVGVVPDGLFALVLIFRVGVDKGLFCDAFGF